MFKSLPFAGLVLCALLAATAWSAQSKLIVEDCELDFLRLPRRVQPTHYKLDMKVDPKEPVFSGRVEIFLKHDQNPNDVLCNNRKNLHLVACDRSKIFLSADESLSILDASYQDEESGLAIPVSSVCRAPDHDLLVVDLSREPGESSRGKLRLSFDGVVRDDFQGLFVGTHRDTRAQVDKSVMITRFQSGHARKMFPCFDEPDFKATFEMSVEHPAHMIASGNTRPLRQEQVRHEDEPEKDYVRTYFATTPRMSSYLLAFVVGEFEHIERSLSDGANSMTLGIYMPPGRSEQAQTSLAIACRGYEALQDFFGIGQPVDKIDFVSSREYPGAMENWGLITIEEFSVLPESETNYEATNRHYSIVTIIHELAHHWFGNLVTPKWWDDLWLNEGFASWLANELADQLYPELNAKFLWLLRDMRTALGMDAKQSETHPIKNSQLKTIDEIEASFDQITYEKSNAVLRMLSDYIGLEKFKEGLRAFIKAKQFDTADDSDLWRALSEASGLDVRQLMHSWIMQAGFPLVSVKLDERNQRLLKVSQMQFPSTSKEVKGAKKRTRSKKPTWMVPITLVVSNGVDKEQKIKFVLSKAKDEIKLPTWFDLGKPGHWLKLNSDFQGFYRVHYETSALLQALREPIETKSIGPADRMNVLEERLGLLQAGLIDEQQLVDLLTWYKNEDHDAVVHLVATVLEHLELDLNADEHNLYSILINHYEKNNRVSQELNARDLLKRMARADTLKRLVTVNYEPAIKDALRLFKQTNGEVPLFARDQILAAVAKAGTEKQFQHVMQLLDEIESDRVKDSSVYQVREALKSNKKRLGKFDKRFPE